MQSINRAMYLAHWHTFSKKNKISESQKVIREWLTKVDNPRIAFSGGKDSTALLLLLKTIGRTDLRVFTLTSDIWMPDLPEHCRYVCKHLGFHHHDIVEADESILQHFAKPDCDLAEMVKIEARAMERYDRDNGIDSVMTGLRALESKGRRLNYNIRGMIYEKRNVLRYQDELPQLYCTPLAKWTGLDVFSMIVGMNAPYFHVYDNDATYLPHERRVGWIISPKRYDTDSIAIIRNDYPDIFSKLVEINPMFGRMA